MKDGLTEGHHLQLLADKGHKVAIEALEGPEFPDALGYLWDWFLELDYARSTTAMEGAGPVTYEQVDAWCRLTDRHPEPFEVRALFVLDIAIRFPPKLLE